jgi:hypothetical protein
MKKDIVFLLDNLDLALLNFLTFFEFLNLDLAAAQFHIQLLDDLIFFLQQTHVAFPLPCQPVLQLLNLLF